MTIPEEVDPAELITSALRLDKNAEPDEEFEFFNGPALSRLSPRKRSFVLHYVIGGDKARGSAMHSYLAAGGTTARVHASECGVVWLRDPNIQAAIREVMEEVEASFKARLGTFTEEAVIAKRLLRDYLLTLSGHPPRNNKGEPNPVLIGSNGLGAIREVLDRAIGKPVQKVESDIGVRADALIRDLAAKRKSPYLPPPPEKRSLDAGSKNLEVLGQVVEEELDLIERGEAPGGGGGTGSEREG